MSDRVMAPNNFTGDLREESWVIEGLDCPDCAASLEKAVAAMPGVAEARLSYASSKLKLQYAPLVVPRERIVASVRDAGYRVGNGDASTPGARPAMRPRESFGQIHQRSLLTAVSGVFLALGFLLSTLGVAEPAPEAAYLLGILLGGFTTARAALFALRARQMDMNVLMSAAVIGAVAIGEWTEAASVVFLFALANALQSYTMDHTRRSIRSLLELAPKEAVVLRGGEQVRIPAEELAPGDILLVRPGEQIATDGVVAAGSSAVNQAPITGESVPVEKGVGDEVFAGTINQRGSMEVRVTRTYQENTLSRIIHMVEEAQAQKAPSQQFVDRFARYYTPAVIALAAAVAVVPPLFFGGSFGDWFYRALVLLIIACPCALVISTPVSIAAAIATAARNGVLFKGGAHLEALAAISVVAFDKTGTLTRGELAVTDVVTLNGLDRGEVLGIAAALEARSEHPLAEAVVRRAREEGVESPRVSGFQALPGLGAEGRVDGAGYFIGSPRLARQRLGDGFPLPPALEELERQGKTAVVLGGEDQLLGIVAATDRLRPEARAAIEGLRDAGIRRVAILTGDNAPTAAAIAEAAGADDVRAELMPQDKQSAVEELLGRYGRVAMVGDGVNDAPALARSTVGIAMGAAGTDTALETADVALMGDDLSKLPFAVRLSRRTVETIKQNVAMSMAIKLLFVVLASLGMANLWMAVLADMGTSVAVIANGMRLLRQRG